jgi:uncharacterized membrane protein YhaH (DUF805 family)
MEEYIKVIKNFANFRGRASRREFWMFILINIIISIILSIIDSALGLKIGSGAMQQGILGLLYSLFIFIPNLAVTIRRLHDINKSGWWLAGFYAAIIVLSVLLVNMQSIIFSLIMLGLAIYFIVLLATPGDTGANEYGPDPYGSDELNIEDHLI